MRYAEAAGQVGEWLSSTAQRAPDGWCWPVRPGVSLEVDPGLGWGTAAPTMFFVEAFRTTGEDRWLAAARQGSRWMSTQLDASMDLPVRPGWFGCGLYTGVGGWCVGLAEWAAAG